MTRDIYFKSTFDCLIKLGNNEWYLIRDRLMAVEVNSSDGRVPICIYPTTSGMISYAFVLDICNMSSSSDLTEVTEYDDCALIRLFPLIMPSTLMYADKSKSVHFAGKSHNVHFAIPSPMRIRLEDGKESIDLCHERIIYNLECIASANSVMIYAQCSEGYIVSVISMKSEKYVVEFVKEVMLLEKDGDQVTTLSHMYDTHHHGMVEKYSISTDFSRKKEIVYIDGKDFIEADKALVPYLFLDAVHCEDYTLAKRYLSQALASKLDTLHLGAFFGEFTDIDSAITEKDGIAVIYNGENGKKYAKVYYFDINKDGKIENITEKN